MAILDMDILWRRPFFSLQNTASTAPRRAGVRVQDRVRVPRRPHAHVSTSMGVGGLLIWLKEAFPEAFTQPETRRSHLLIDANSQVHDAIRNSRGARETEVIRRFVGSVDQLVQQYQPSRGLSVALDGPAPLAKLETQRQRRLKKKVLLTPCISHPTPHTVHLTPHTPHLTPYTLPSTSHLTPHRLAVRGRLVCQATRSRQALLSWA